MAVALMLHREYALYLLLFLLVYSAITNTSLNVGVSAFDTDYGTCTATTSNVSSSHNSPCANATSQTNSQQLENKDRVNVIRLLSFFPCVFDFSDDGDKLIDDSKFNTLIRECDILLYVAARLAQERINSKGSEMQGKLELVHIETGMVSER